jgi:putative peptidoglycan lipid II flippase
VQAFSQLPSLYRVGYRWRPKQDHEAVWYQEPALYRIGFLILPGIVGLAATQFNVLMNSVWATSLGVGAVSYLSYSFRLMQFPIGVFGVSLASATLPQVSTLFVQERFEELQTTLSRSLKQVFAINLPAAFGLIVVGIPLIQLLFEHGKFQAADTQGTFEALCAYSLGLPFYSGVKVLVPTCYALRKTQHAVISSVLSVGVTLMSGYLLKEPYGFQGLALSTSIAAAFNFGYLMLLLRKHLHLQELLRSSLLSFLISFGMASVLWMLQRGLVLSGMDYGAWHGALLILYRMLKVLILSFLGALLVYVLSLVLKHQEGIEMGRFILRKIKK